jgi:hypothetical protein
VSTADTVGLFSVSAAATKQTKISDLSTIIGAPPVVATQAQQEAAVSGAVFVAPSVQQYHPSACKAWGLITPATTVSASYPAAGVSVVKNGTGDYTVTHGVTFSSGNYCAQVTPVYNGPIQTAVFSISATTIRVIFSIYTGADVDPTQFSYACFGDLV